MTNVNRYVAARAALLFSIILLSSGAAQAASGAPRRTFDEGWRELLRLERAPLPTDVGRREVMLVYSERTRQRIRLARELFEEHPQDPRRWEVAEKIIRTVGGDVYEVAGDPEKDGSGVVKRDVAAQAAWDAYARGLYEQMLAFSDLPVDLQVAAIDAWIDRLNMTPHSTLAEERAAIDELLRRFPDEPRAAIFEQRYNRRLRRESSAAAANHLETMLRSPNAAVRAAAEGMSRIDVGQRIDLKFTALDGREVDLAKLRGKVVLIDFWATWCGPCVAELPNVKRVYEQYHDKGFEVIAISAENAGFKPTDTAAERAEKLAKSREKLLAYCREHGLPWPQYFDGEYWKNPIMRRFSITAIPEMFLIDQQGKIASTAARGEKLEAEVKRLLGL